MSDSRTRDHMTENSDSVPAAKIVLASRSPRRRRLLGWLGMPFETTAVDTPEELDTPLASNPRALAASLAAEKAVAARADGHGSRGLVLCFDTIVVLDGRVLGKPWDVADARRMLHALSGRMHQVVTGVAMMCPDDSRPRTLSVTTEVSMRVLDEAAIEEWMAMGTFLGCAGAYNIEAQVADVAADECYQNVAGLPLCHVYAELACGDVRCLPGVPLVPVAACDAALGRTCRLGPSLVRPCAGASPAPSSTE